MAARKDSSPSIATYADHEVITPAHDLRKVVRAAVEGEEDPVARAEAALVQLSRRVRRLDAGRMRAPRSGAAERGSPGL